MPVPHLNATKKVGGLVGGPWDRPGSPAGTASSAPAAGSSPVYGFKNVNPNAADPWQPGGTYGQQQAQVKSYLNPVGRGGPPTGGLEPGIEPPVGSVWHPSGTPGKVIPGSGGRMNYFREDDGGL